MGLRNLQSWLPFLFTLQASIVRASFWTVTSNYELEMSTSTDIYDTDTYYYTYSTTRTISKGVTPTSRAVSSETYYSTYADLEIISVFYPDNAVADSDLYPTDYLDYDPTGSVGTIFLMPVTYTAPSSCSSSFTFATNETVFPPSQVVDQLTPQTIITEAPYAYSTYTGAADETWLLTKEAVPITTTAEYYYEYYVASCTTPYSFSNTGLSSGGDDSGSGSGSSYTYCYSYYGSCTSLKIWIIIIASVIPALFLLGFLESWFWFRRLMTGRGCLRFGTVCWIGISLWVACFTRSQSARSHNDQKLLREQWNRMGSGTAFKLWWRWGFRHAYPTELLGQYSRNDVGIVPLGAAAPGSQPLVFGQGQGQQPQMQMGMGQQGQVVAPPPQYMHQHNSSGPPPPAMGAMGMGMGNSYYEQKEVASVTETQTPITAHSPAPATATTVSPISQTPPPVQVHMPQPIHPISEMPHPVQTPPPPPSEMYSGQTTQPVEMYGGMNSPVPYNQYPAPAPAPQNQMPPSQSPQGQMGYAAPQQQQQQQFQQGQVYAPQPTQAPQGGQGQQAYHPPPNQHPPPNSG
ncbi:hypothetical protein K491DRAFT_780166 [Lophiostoma macrostomum CBS 122681]|uniref:Uncharacterized protein n=1 Tax=Lophiostoma macrostomum CBS 122681 TaxID=1314788 RepID=A0A6A6T372_9PLEO|nr:hypothetical protein K491DRAFT_780166 [Lophiostoma macrostomum CBS 122681]